MSVLVTPNDDVPMSSVAAAALEACGPDQIWLDTGGTVHGIRVPDEATAEAVRAQAVLLAGGVHHENGLTTSVAPEETGRPSCGPGPDAPAEPVQQPPQRRRARPKKTSPEEQS